MSKHTPRPWGIDALETAGGAPVIVAKTCWRNKPRRIAKVLYEFGSEDPEVAANAEHIVACVNSHDDLLASCKEMVEVNKHLLRLLFDAGATEGLNLKHNGCGVRAQEAIARAEGLEGKNVEIEKR